MAKKRKATRKKSAPKRKNKSMMDKVVEAISPSRRNTRGGNVTRRQGV